MSNTICELDGVELVITMSSRADNKISGEVKYGGKYYAIPEFECYHSSTKTDEAMIDRFKILLDEIELERQMTENY